MSLWAMETFTLQQPPGKVTMSRILNDPKPQAKQSSDDRDKFRNRIPKHEDRDRVVYDYDCDMANKRRASLRISSDRKRSTWPPKRKKRSMGTTRLRSPFRGLVTLLQKKDGI